MILTVDAALDGCGAGLVRDGVVLAEVRAAGGRGSAAALPGLVQSVLASMPGLVGAVAVTVGPGSFTGVRAALALAQGLGLGWGVPVWGVSVGGAVRAGNPAGGPVWVAVDSRRGRVFLDVDGAIAGFALEGLPRPAGPVRVGGDAAEAVVAWLTGAGCVAELVGAPLPGAGGIAAAALERALPAAPLYIDAPEARQGGAGRPAPG